MNHQQTLTLLINIVAATVGAEISGDLAQWPIRLVEHVERARTLLGEASNEGTKS
jgi:hypothetical protein